MATAKAKLESVPDDDGLGLASLQDQDDFVNILYYGDGGSGKTSDLAFFAKLGPVVYVLGEPGLKKRPLLELGIPIENLRIFDDITYDGLDKLSESLRIKLDSDPGSVAAVTMDSATAIHLALVRPIVAKGVRKSEAKGVEREEFDIYQEDWGVMTEQMRKIVRQFLDLPCHFGISALERRDQDDDGTVKYGPAVTPKLGTSLYGDVDLVCHTTVEELPGWNPDDDDDMYVGSFRAVGKYRAKDRFKAVPKRMPNPTADRVVAYVRGELTKETDPLLAKARELRAKQKANEEAKKEKGGK